MQLNYNAEKQSVILNPLIQDILSSFLAWHIV